MITDNNYKIKSTDFSDSQQELLDRAKEEQDNFDWDQVDKDMAQEKKEENRKTYSPPYQGQVHGGGDGAPDKSTSNNQPGGFTSKDSARESYSRYARGGITNVNMNRGQLGETLYG